MATRLFLRDAAPANDPGTTTNSSVLPVHTDNSDFGLAVKSLSRTIGTSEATLSGDAITTTNTQDNFFTSFSSAPLTGTNITAQTWTIAIDVAEDNNGANSFTVLSIYVFREPSTVVGFVYDSDTALGAEWNGAGRGRVATFSGSAVTVAADDYLVLEVWRHTAGQTMATAWTQILAYDGTVPVTEGSSSSAASYLETPQDGIFPALGRRHQQTVVV